MREWVHAKLVQWERGCQWVCVCDVCLCEMCNERSFSLFLVLFIRNLIYYWRLFSSNSQSPASSLRGRSCVYQTHPLYLSRFFLSLSLSPFALSVPKESVDNYSTFGHMLHHFRFSYRIKASLWSACNSRTTHQTVVTTLQKQLSLMFGARSEAMVSC